MISAFSKNQWQCRSQRRCKECTPFIITAEAITAMSRRALTYYPPPIANQNIRFKPGVKYERKGFEGKRTNGGFIDGNATGKCRGITEGGCPVAVWANYKYCGGGDIIPLCKVCGAIGEPDKHTDMSLIPYCKKYNEKGGVKVADKNNQVHLCMGDEEEFNRQTRNKIIQVHNLKYYLDKMEMEMDEGIGLLTAEIQRLILSDIFPKEGGVLLENRGSPYFLTAPAAYTKYLKKKLEDECPTLMKVINQLMEECNMNLCNAFVACYLTAEGYKEHLGEEEFAKLEEIVYGYFKWHQDQGFGGADARMLMSWSDSDERKKMMFVDRKTNKWYQFFAPGGTFVIFSREGGGVLKHSSIFHAIADGAGTVTFAVEGKHRKEKTEAIDEEEEEEEAGQV